MTESELDPTSLSRERFIQCQQDDTDCGRYRDDIEEITPEDPVVFVIPAKGSLEDILCRQGDASKASRRLRPVVPRSLVRLVLRSHHGIPLAGHRGQNETLQLIKRRWWWKDMTDDITRYVAACVPCNRRKFPRPARAGLACNISAPRPLWRICIGHMGARGKVQLR